MSSCHQVQSNNKRFCAQLYFNYSHGTHASDALPIHYACLVYNRAKAVRFELVCLTFPRRAMHLSKLRSSSITASFTIEVNRIPKVNPMTRIPTTVRSHQNRNWIWANEKLSFARVRIMPRAADRLIALLISSNLIKEKAGQTRCYLFLFDTRLQVSFRRPASVHGRV